MYKYLYPYKYNDILKFHHDNLVEMTKNEDCDSERVQEFINNISPYFIRIKKKDLNLPPIKNSTIRVDMDGQQREIYDFIESKYVKSFKKNNLGTVKDLMNRAKLIRLRQAAVNPSLLQKTIKENLDNEDIDYDIFNHQAFEEFQDDSNVLEKIYNYSKSNIPNKFIKVKEILLNNVIINKEKAIVWTIFIQNAKELKKYLNQNGIKAELLIGEIDTAEREMVIKKFNNPENNEFQVIIANPFAVAESISLHKGCHSAIYLERDYNCSNFLQSKDRIHRVGLNKNQETNYYYLLSSDSIDEVINDKLNDKVKRMEKIIDDDIPLFSIINDSDETDLIKALIDDYVRRT
jgi:hypothetical protein